MKIIIYPKELRRIEISPSLSIIDPDNLSKG